MYVYLLKWFWLWMLSRVHEGAVGQWLLVGAAGQPLAGGGTVTEWLISSLLFFFKPYSFVLLNTYSTNVLMAEVSFERIFSSRSPAGVLDVERQVPHAALLLGAFRQSFSTWPLLAFWTRLSLIMEAVLGTLGL